MKAIYKGKLYQMGDNLNVAELIDEDEKGNVHGTIEVDYGNPDLIVDPTDGQLADIESPSAEAQQPQRPDSVSAIVTLIEHAKEMYPHFESIRGQHDIANAEWAVTQLGNITKQRDEARDHAERLAAAARNMRDNWEKNLTEPMNKLMAELAAYESSKNEGQLASSPVETRSKSQRSKAFRNEKKARKALTAKRIADSAASERLLTFRRTKAQMEALEKRSYELETRSILKSEGNTSAEAQQPQHSPLPWQVNRYDRSSDGYIDDACGNGVIGSMYGDPDQVEANCELIVASVNASRERLAAAAADVLFIAKPWARLAKGTQGRNAYDKLKAELAAYYQSTKETK